MQIRFSLSFFVILLIILNVLDILTTYVVVFCLGGIELNPMAVSLFASVGFLNASIFKMVCFILLIPLILVVPFKVSKNESDKKIAKVFSWSMFIFLDSFYAVAVINNTINLVKI